MFMIRMFTAFTEEIDDVETAVSEVLNQLELDDRLKSHSVGILHCACDFDESDVVRELCERLPFDVVGCTSLSVQTTGIKSQIALTVTVLTSDDVRFVSGVSSPISDDLNGPVTELYGRVMGNTPEKPAMIMPFVPFMKKIGGDEFVEKLNELSARQIPAFGTVAISGEAGSGRTYTIHNGRFYPTSMVLLALFGDVDPMFFSAAVPEDKILKQKAIVTGIDKNILKTVNNMPAIAYLESVGLAKGGILTGFESMPFVIKLNDGSVLTRACIASTPDGGIILCGSMPVNSTLAIATMGPEDVIATTEAKVREAIAKSGGGNMIMYSCAARAWMLGTKVMAEHDRVDECIGDSAAYHFVYSGGEIFPAFLEDGSISNQLQNDSMIICVL
jgi:hypothetical protein